jgi:hypothetical protein
MDVVVGAKLQSAGPLTIVVVFNFWGFWAWALQSPGARSRLAAKAKTGIHAGFLSLRFCGREWWFFIVAVSLNAKDGALARIDEI